MRPDVSMPIDSSPSVPQQLPASGDESIGIDTSGLIDGLQRTVRRIAEYQWPDDVAVTFDHGMGAAQAERLVGVERGVDAAEDHHRPSGPREGAEFVSAKCIAGVNTHADDIAGLN